MTVRVLGIAVLCVAFAAPRVRAQTERLAGRLGEPARAAVSAIVDSAIARKLPAEPLVNRALAA